jgi:alkanesulfonate monooxygenase SsuD/methylene tetrahydromethanopterin reductase-like flavin-dependent oxidoreductase (luciferase family)
MVDPWVALAAVALHTKHLRIGAMVTPLARRRPWKVAREAVSVDLLSEGRLIFGAGLGDPVQWDFGFFGEEEDARLRAQKLDEALEIITGLWQGEMFSYRGEHYQLKAMRFEPTPIQQPRIPIWIGGGWDRVKPQQRAARYDGYIPLKFGSNLTIQEWQSIKQNIFRYLDPEKPFDLIHSGITLGEDRQIAIQTVEPYQDLGITWWLESVDPWRWGDSWEEPITPQAVQQMEERIRQGPPRE